MVSKTMHLYKGLVRPSKKNCLSEEKRLVRNFSSDSQFLFEGFSCSRMVNYLVRLSMPVEANDSLVGMRLFDTWHHPMRALWLPYIFHETKAVNGNWRISQWLENWPSLRAFSRHCEIRQFPLTALHRICLQYHAILFIFGSFRKQLFTRT